MKPTVGTRTNTSDDMSKIPILFLTGPGYTALAPGRGRARGPAHQPHQAKEARKDATFVAPFSKPPAFAPRRSLQSLVLPFGGPTRRSPDRLLRSRPAPLRVPLP